MVLKMFAQRVWGAENQIKQENEFASTSRGLEKKVGAAVKLRKRCNEAQKICFLWA